MNYPEIIRAQRFKPLPIDHVWNWLAKGELLAPIPVESRLLRLIWYIGIKYFVPGYRCDSCKTTFIGYSVGELQRYVCEER